MPSDPSVKSGVLSNGTNYYVMANADTKGMADFALVQKSGKSVSANLLDAIPVLKGGSPRDFFMRNAVVPHNGRFLEIKDDASIFRFYDVVTSAEQPLLDSTLLVLIGMVDAARENCPLADNAVIVSGDVNADEVVGKLKMLSYMVPSGKGLQERTYHWEDSQAKYSVCKTDGEVSEISIKWRFPRTPKQYAGTIQPAVHSKLIYELGSIAKMRISQLCADRGISISKLSHRHISSSQTSSDEELRISAIVGKGTELSAVTAMVDALSSLAQNGISVAERNRADVDFIRHMSELARRPVRMDASNVELCINAFLNDAKPVTNLWLYEFYKSKAVNDTLETRSLELLADAVLKVDKNAELKLFTSSDLSESNLKHAIDSVWNATSTSSAVKMVPPTDTLLKLVAQKKLPVISIRKEHMSDGNIWKFSNGIRVVYKRMDTGGRFYWALGLSEGYGNIKNLSAGEGAFVTDMLKLSKVSGMPWNDFVAFWAAQDIYIDANVDLYNTVLHGSSPSYDLPSLMRVMRAVVEEREFDNAAFNLYKREQWLSLQDTKGSSRRVVDSLMCPGYKYSKIKSSGKLTDNLPAKTEVLFDNIFSKINDGIIVLVGDVDESLVRKQLCEYLRGFATRGSVPVRPSISYQTLSGSMTHEVQGRRNAIYMAMSVTMPLTIDNYALADVASMVLNKKLSSALVGSGMYARVYSDTRITPTERFNVLIVLEEVSGINREDAENAARSVIKSELTEEGFADFTDVQVNACKTWLKHNHQVRMNSPEYWVNALLVRYLEGKDFTTGYDAKIDEVTSDEVKSLLLSLNKSGKVEYIIRRK